MRAIGLDSGKIEASAAIPNRAIFRSEPSQMAQRGSCRSVLPIKRAPELEISAAAAKSWHRAAPPVSHYYFVLLVGSAIDMILNTQASVPPLVWSTARNLPARWTEFLEGPAVG